MPTNETKIYITLLIAVAIVAVFLVFFVITMLKYQQKYRNLYRQLIKAEITSTEQERKRIAADLHDDFGQILSVVRLQIGNITPQTNLDKEMIGSSAKYIDEMLVRMRTMGEGLVPDSLLNNSFEQAVIKLLQTLHQTGLVQVSWQLEGCEQLDGYDHGIHLYRIIQEIVSNVVKHSKASTLHIAMHKQGNQLKIHARDNGIGFQYEVMEQGLVGAGLRNIHNRVALLEGTIYLTTHPGKGVQYHIIIPLAYAKQ